MSKKGAGRNKEEIRDRNYGRLQLVLVILFIGGAVLLSRYLKGLEATPDTGRQTGLRELLVETIEAEPRSVRLMFSTTATVQVRSLTDIVPQVSGRVVAIDDHAFPGGVINPDIIIFEIEKEDFRLEVERMEAEVSRAKTGVELQQENREAAVSEWRQLNPEKPLPPLVAEPPQLKEARAVLKSAQAGLKIAQLNLSRTDYRLPYTGRVTEFHLELGQYAVAGQSYGSIYRLASLEIDVPLDEIQLGWLLETEDPVITVTSGYLNPDTYPGYVKRVSGRVDPDTRFRRVILGLKDPEPDLVPNLFVTVHITGPVREDVWTLPLDALQENQSFWQVTPENRLSSLKPEILQITGAYIVAKSNGAGVRVVRGSLPEATEGTPVRPAQSSDAQGSDR